MPEKYEVLNKYRRAKETGKLNLINEPLPENIKKCLVSFLVKSSSLSIKDEKIIRVFLDYYGDDLLRYIIKSNTNPYKPVQTLLDTKKEVDSKKYMIFEFTDLLIAHDSEKSIHISEIDRLLAQYDGSEFEFQNQSTRGTNIKKVGVFDGSMLMTKPNLRQLYLYFDEFFVIDVEKWEKLANLKELENSYLNLKNRKELDWLFEKHIIQPHNFPYEKELVQDQVLKQDYNFLTQLLDSDTFHNLTKETGKTKLGYEEIGDFMYKYSIAKARLQSGYLNLKFEYDAAPIIDNLSDLSLYISDLPKAHVLNVLIKKIPIPKIDTRWEEILEFKQDPDSTKKFKELSNWLSTVSTNEVRTKEIYQKIEYLLQEYEAHMRFHKMKFDFGSYNTSLVMNEDGFQNLSEHQFAGNAGFHFKMLELALFNSERNAPGRELAYIVKANQHFK